MSGYDRPLSVPTINRYYILNKTDEARLYVGRFLIGGAFSRGRISFMAIDPKPSDAETPETAFERFKHALAVIATVPKDAVAEKKPDKSQRPKADTAKG